MVSFTVVLQSVLMTNFRSTGHGRQSGLTVWHAQNAIRYLKSYDMTRTHSMTTILCFFTRRTFVWQSTKFAVFLCLVTDISATVAPIGLKFCMMVHIGRGQIFSPFGGGAPKHPQIRNSGPKFWPFDREYMYMENSKSQRYMSIRASARRELSKNVSHRAVAPRGVHYKQTYVPSVGKGGEGVAHSFNCTPRPHPHPRYAGFVSC